MSNLYTWDDVHKAAHKIAIQMYNSAWRPDCIVGLNTDSYALAVIVANLLDVKAFTLDVEDEESNLWLAEWAFGYESVKDRDDVWSSSRSNPSVKKNILIVQHETNSDTIDWLQKDWRSGCMPDSVDWNYVWHKNVKFASMHETHNEQFDTDFVAFTSDDKYTYPWQYD